MAAAAAGAVMVGVLATATPAGAIAKTSSSPAAGSTVSPPEEVSVVHDVPMDTAASTITVRNKNSNVVGGSKSFTTTTVPNDTIVFTPTSSPLTEAGSPYTVDVHGDDLIGTGTVDTQLTFSVDGTLPAAPTITSVTNPVNNTNKAAVQAVGTAEAGSTVTVGIDDDGDEGTDPVFGAGLATGGSYMVSVDTTSLNDGPLTVWAYATDPAGNVGPNATTSTTKDTVVPAAPDPDFVETEITAANQGAIHIDGTSGAQGLTINVSVDDASQPATSPVTASTTAGVGGAWSVTVDLTSLQQGTITASATAKDAALNTSTPGTDTVQKELGAPELVGTTPSGGASVAEVPEVTATYNEALKTSTSTITVKDDTDLAVGGTTTFRDGDKTIVFTPAGPLSEGGSPYSVTAAVEDAAGNPITPTTTWTFTVDTTAPAAPVVSTVTDPITPANETAITITGTAESGATVDVTATDGETTVTADTQATGGSWSVQLDVSSLDDGTISVTATATDAAGNTSDESTAETATKDTTAPADPSITTLTDPVNAANEDAVQVGGEAETGADIDVTVEDGDGTTVSESTTANSPWSVSVDTTSLDDGTLTVTVTATDAAGNVSDETIDSTTKDTVAPPSPVITSATDPVVPSNAASFTVQGTAPAGTTTTVTVEDPDGTTVSGSTTGTSWTRSLNVTGLDGGTLTITATSTDAAGNPSAPSAPETVTKVFTNVTFASTGLSVSGNYQPLSGDFDGDGPDDAFWYAPGTAKDYLWISDGDGTFTSFAVPVNGTYRPAVGDFDGNGFADILWYGPGTAKDYLWLSDGSEFESNAVSIGLDAIPLVGDYDGEEGDDLFLYGVGSKADRLLLSQGNGSFTSRSVNVGGTYRPVTGDFDGDGLTDIFWYGPGSGADYIWSSDGDGTFTSSALNDPGTYVPLVGDFNADGRDDLFKYRAGSGVDQLLLSGIGVRSYSVGGTYRPVVGDFDGNGAADIIWYGPGSASDHLWRATPRT